MVDNRRHSDQSDFEFVQNLFNQVKPESASPELKAKILMSEQIRRSNTGFSELLDYLWPFGALWRPVAGLSMAAMFGIILGLTDPLSTVDSDEALTEEIVAFVTEVDGQLGDIE